MVFHANMAFALEILALVASAALLFWAGKPESRCGRFASVIALIGIGLSILTMGCTTFHALKYASDDEQCSAHGAASEKMDDSCCRKSGANKSHPMMPHGAGGMMQHGSGPMMMPQGNGGMTKPNHPPMGQPMTNPSSGQTAPASDDKE